MSDASGAPKSPTLEPPEKSVELEDPGAHDLDSNLGDAKEASKSPQRSHSPIPLTRVERVDDRENHGEVPGTAAYELRTQDAVPDEVEIFKEKCPQSSDIQQSSDDVEQSMQSAPSPIPTTIVDKVDPDSPSYGELPGTAAYDQRQADAVPDVVRGASDHEEKPQSGSQMSAGLSPSKETGLDGAQSSPRPIPITKITRVDSKPSYGEVPGTEAFEIRQSDADADIIEKQDDVSTSREGMTAIHEPEQFTPKIKDPDDAGSDPAAMQQIRTRLNEEQGSNKAQDSEAAAEEANVLGDDFDDFEAGEDNDVFDDFCDAVEPSQSVPVATSPVPAFSPDHVPAPLDLPPLDFTLCKNNQERQEALQPYIERMFPEVQKANDLHSHEPLAKPSPSDSLFLSERSLSLWSQLIAPPPLNPPNWIRSRTRRLFLVSLGVPVDLDEILPASKQKKLVLPSTTIAKPTDRKEGATTRNLSSTHNLPNDNSQVSENANDSQSRLESNTATQTSDLDMPLAFHLSNTTASALTNMSDVELAAHSQLVESLTTTASVVLEYWLRRRDSAIGDREAFEGVIENLVQHAQRARKKKK